MSYRNQECILAIGDYVIHEKFGRGLIKDISKSGREEIVKLSLKTLVRKP